jgi:hypothetical protein
MGLQFLFKRLEERSRGNRRIFAVVPFFLTKAVPRASAGYRVIVLPAV